jgi:UDPglucose--hexose-1-phosphate uridylyltransferase
VKAGAQNRRPGFGAVKVIDLGGTSIPMNLSDFPHRRYNPLLGEWLLVSPHRTKRPWQGKIERVSRTDVPEYDASCYLCPGNRRAGADLNPPYENTFVFVNDFSALLTDSPSGETADGGLLMASSERGTCKVICFSPKHNLTFALMKPVDIRKVVDVWIEQYQELGSIAFINYVQIFENRGEIMGCSNQHPHGQIWANESIPTQPAKEGQRQQEYREKNKSCLLCDYIEKEKNNQARIVVENGSFIALVPFWAIWPFETMVLPKIHATDISTLSEQSKTDLADIMHQLAIRYDNLFETDFPYSFGIHQRPTDDQPHEEWHFHLHYFPPLLRSAVIKKFMVGYELLAMPQRDFTPEESARRLRACADEHFSMQ